MPKSMTAFANNCAKYPWGTLTWELRSINHRYLEATFRLPETLRHQEFAYREHLRQVVQRGKLDCTLKIDFEQRQELDINLQAAQKYIQACESVSTLIQGAPAPLSALDVLQAPGVMESKQIDPEILATAAQQSYDRTLQELVDARLREGSRLSIFIQQRLDKISTEVSSIRNILPQLQALQEQRLWDKLSTITAEIDGERLEQELLYLANKSDVNEELDRLETHIEEFIRTLESETAIGRRLDFILQELNREANTLSSKSQASVTTHSAIELKVLIEQIREQVQNLE